MEDRVALDAIEVAIVAPDRMRESSLDPEADSYAEDDVFATLRMRNLGPVAVRIPFHEISRNLAMRVRNPRTDAAEIFDSTPPPRPAPPVVSLMPGDALSATLAMEYAPVLLATDAEETELELTVIWDAENLRSFAYPDGAFDWNRSFALSVRYVVTHREDRRR